MSLAQEGKAGLTNGGLRRGNRALGVEGGEDWALGVEGGETAGHWEWRGGETAGHWEWEEGREEEKWGSGELSTG